VDGKKYKAFYINCKQKKNSKENCDKQASLSNDKEHKNASKITLKIMLNSDIF
jgi:hypothetical protein